MTRATTHKKKPLVTDQR